MKPILFNTEMVRAVLDGTKAMTRRPIEPQPLEDVNRVIMETGLEKTVRAKFMAHTYDLSRYQSPPHNVGDILYVRETFTVYQTVNYVRAYDGRSFSESSDGQYAYKADGYDGIEDLCDHIRLMSDCSLEKVFIKDDRWFPSIHMPKEAARLFLCVTALKAERVQDISEADAIAEGFESRDGFKDFWIDKYGKESWERNDWVWAYTLKRIDKSEVEK